MSDQGNTTEEILLQNQENDTTSIIYPDNFVLNEQNDSTEFGSTGLNNNTDQTSDKKNNFPKKENFSDKKLEVFFNHGMTKLKLIDALELNKFYEYYYLETKINESFNMENKEFALTKSKNYVPKAVLSQDNIFGSHTEQLFLYYKIKIKDTMYCTYINNHYGLHKVAYKISQQSNNNTT